MIIERNKIENWLPLEYPEGYRYTVKFGKNKAMVLDLRNFTKVRIDTVPAVSWLDGYEYGTNDIISRSIDWDKVERHLSAPKDEQEVEK